MAVVQLYDAIIVITVLQRGYFPDYLQKSFKGFDEIIVFEKVSMLAL